MRVRDCENCRYYVRKRFVTYYEPKDYHPIGLTHYYAFCSLHKDKCLNVKRCASMGDFNEAVSNFDKVDITKE